MIDCQQQMILMLVIYGDITSTAWMCVVRMRDITLTAGLGLININNNPYECY